MAAVCRIAAGIARPAGAAAGVEVGSGVGLGSGVGVIEGGGVVGVSVGVGVGVGEGVHATNSIAMRMRPTYLTNNLPFVQPHCRYDNAGMTYTVIIAAR